MAPKPKPLQQRGYLCGNNVIRIEPCEMEDDLDVDERGTAPSLRDQGTQQQPGGSSQAQPVPEQETTVFMAPRRSGDSGKDKAQAQKAAVRVAAMDLRKKKESDDRITQNPPQCTLKKQDHVGVMVRHEDLLDRTFDNIEVFVCKDNTTRSPKAGPPPPVFSCTDSRAARQSVGNDLIGNTMRHDDLLDRTFDNVELFVCKDKTTRPPTAGPPPPIFFCADRSAAQPIMGDELVGNKILHDDLLDRTFDNVEHLVCNNKAASTSIARPLPPVYSSTSITAESRHMGNELHDDLLDRTFDNVEHFVCNDRTIRSPKEGPQTPILSCTDKSAAQTMRHDDLLDRTFDNIEHFVCKDKVTRSPSAGPPPPLFTCTDSNAEHHSVDNKPVGIIMRRDDLLDRTFNNVEHFVCEGETTRSPTTGPLPPIFSCTDNTAVHDSMGSDLLELSNAKRLGNAIEVSDGSVIGNSVLMDDLGTVNSIIDDRSGDNDWNRSAKPNQDQARSLMLGLFLDSVNGILCRETTMAAVQSPTTSDAIMKTEEDQVPPINLHPIVDGVNANRTLDSCGDVFKTVDPTFPTKPKTPSITSGRLSGENADSHASAMVKTKPTVPLAGMMLLPDGSIVFPFQYKAEQERKLQLKTQHMQQILSSNRSSLRMSRENSLLDLEASLGSGEDTALSRDDDDRVDRLRQKKRALEERLSRNMTTTAQDVVAPVNRGSQVGSLEEKYGDSAVVVQQIERSRFRKCVIFAVTLLMVSCALIIFALSFFWPTDRLG